jgi:hypothetical protein
MAREYGGAMNVGYVPDTFGHIAQLPQILRGFGMETAVFWRGVGPEMTGDFRWRAPDGEEVRVVCYVMATVTRRTCRWTASSLPGGRARSPRAGARKTLMRC